MYVKKVCDEIKKFPSFMEGWRADKRDGVVHSVETIYFGGGTPSFIDAGLISDILQTVRESFTVAPDAEISIECNPNSLTREKLQVYRDCGINRISIGVQSFNNRTLRTLGRLHNAKQAKAAVKLACKSFPNVSIDLMHSVPNANYKLRITNYKLLKKIKHVSAYALTSDRYTEVSDEKSIKEQQRIEKRLGKLGFDKYEISNFARPGFECRHNVVYWTCGDWLGFGEGAESHFGEEWSNNDRIMMGMRMVRGVSCELLSDKRQAVEELVRKGLVKVENGYVKCTENGFLLNNYVINSLI